ncbi:MAG: protein-S-isoprenylcysteine O-methyltransferase [Ahrensia sp.]|nr:protein-S-isoprenylcysteine O-methyltransferase [Ahrensia sp.]
MTQFVASIIWCLGIATWLAIRWPHRRRARKTKIVAHRRSAGERVALGLTILGLVVVPLTWILTDLVEFADYPFSPIQGWIGAALMIAFLVMFHLSHAHLARNWSVTLELRANHELVDTGVYGRIRHPMYTSFWLWGLAQLFLIPNAFAGATGLASIAWLYFSRVGEEEEMMRAHFGEAYEAYCGRTGRLLPKFTANE